MIGITSERDLETKVREILRSKVLPSLNDQVHLLTSKKAVDIVLCRQGENPKLFLLEIKYHKIQHGRLGFGHKKGGGFQPEILKSSYHYFENNLRWILGSEETDDFYFA